MNDEGERKKIQEARYIMFVPILITVICAWLDIWCTYSSGEYVNSTCREIFLSITRCIYGYFFPSFVSMIIPLVLQQLFSENKQYGLQKNKIGFSVLFLVIYCVIFITCLINFNVTTSIIFMISTFVYIGVTWNYCLDNEIKHLPNPNLEKEETNKLADYIQKQIRKGDNK